MIDSELEYYTQLSIAKEIRDAFPTKVVQVQGFSYPVGTAEDWLSIDMVEVMRRRSRKDVFLSKLMFRVKCSSRVANTRTDNKTSIPWSIAGQVRNALEKKDMSVKKYGTSAQATIGVLSINEGELRYDSGSSRIKGEAGYHSVVVTFTASMNFR